MSHPPDLLGALAVHGGDRLRAAPFPPRGHFGAAEKEAVVALLDRAAASGQAPGYNGDEETAYCQEFAASLGGGYADAVSSGTAAVYVALQALGLEPFGEVIVSAVTDPGGMMAIPLLNLVPVVADSAPGSYNSGPEQVAALITPLTRAVVIAHIGGEPADLPGILELAQAHGIPVIEDCAQAHGARLHGQTVGTFGQAAAFSTMSGKHHCTGSQGGVVYTRDEALYQACRRCSDRGKPFFLPAGATNAVAGLNLNLNDLAAAIGRVQLGKLPGVVGRRQAVVAKLAEGLASLACVSLPPRLLGAEASYWFLRLRFHPQRATCDKATYCQALSAEGLPITPSYQAALPHTMEWFVQRRVFGRSGYPWASPDYGGDPQRQFPCPNAHVAVAEHFNLHIHENWQDDDVRDALAIFRRVDAYYRSIG